MLSLTFNAALLIYSQKKLSKAKNKYRIKKNFFLKRGEKNLRELVLFSTEKRRLWGKPHCSFLVL